MLNPHSVLERVRRDVERNALRTRNGIRLATGARTSVGCTPKDVAWRSGRTELWHYRNDDVRFTPPLLIVFSLISRSYILDLSPGNSFVERLLKADGKHPEVQRLRKMLIHMIEAEHAMEKLGIASKMNTDLDFLLYLKGLGRRTAERWLEKNFAALNHYSSLDIRKVFL